MKKNSKNSALFWILDRVKGQKRYIAVLILANMLFASSVVIFSLACQGLIDGAVASNLSVVKEYGLFLFGIVLFRLLIRIFANSLQEFLNGRLTNNVRQDVLKQLLQKEYYEVGRYHSGELVNRMFSDVKIVVDGILNILPVVANLATRLIGAVLVLVKLDSKFTLLFCIVGVGSFLVTRLFRKKIKGLHKEVQTQEGRVHAFLQESIENIRLIKSADMEDKIQQQNKAYQQDFFQAQMHRRTYNIISSSGMAFIFQGGYLYALLWGAFKISTRAMTYGTLTAILQLVGQIQAPFSSMSGLLQKYFGMIASAERLEELFLLKDEEVCQEEVLETKLCEENASFQVFDQIRIIDLAFSYDNVEVLKNVDMNICSGDCVSIQGLSGGGKSTLFLLLLGIYKPQQGRIEIQGGGRIQNACKETRSMFAYVPQGNTLFSGTIRENIAMFCGPVSDEEIWNAAEQACIKEFLLEQREGLDTVIGERGIGLSEGQAQRIAIARALLSGAPVLLLDECTSALDNETERNVLMNIARLKDKTCMIVTHREEALKICNRHFYLEDGCLSEKEKNSQN